MRKISVLVFSFSLWRLLLLHKSRKEKKKTQQGHTDQNKFRQMKDVLATPNDQHTASGAPGQQYTQQKVDYVMDIRLDESANRIYGDEKITYHNNSKDHLEYLWVQLDQNMRADDSKTPCEIWTVLSFYYSSEFTEYLYERKKGFGLTLES